MDLNFFLICFGVLGCYAVLRTARHGWIKLLVVLALVAALGQLAVTKFLHKDTSAGAVAYSGMGDFLHAKLTQLRTDRCILRYMKETPLSPLAYEAELQNFLEAFKKMNMSGQRAGIAPISQLLSQSFSDVSPDLSPDETSAIQSNGETDPRSLCTAFGKWVGKVSGYSEKDQQKIWQSLASPGQ